MKYSSILLLLFYSIFCLYGCIGIQEEKPDNKWKDSSVSTEKRQLNGLEIAEIYRLIYKQAKTENKENETMTQKEI